MIISLKDYKLSKLIHECCSLMLSQENIEKRKALSLLSKQSASGYIKSGLLSIQIEQYWYQVIDWHLNGFSFRLSPMRSFDNNQIFILRNAIYGNIDKLTLFLRAEIREINNYQAEAFFLDNGTKGIRDFNDFMARWALFEFPTAYT